ncbi:hypothetical protein PS918_01127 [Pseudomonas fluorescens]|uniref:Uncharacterized protein n=1 Tax=Pseudomonas fluorescens TaxID=294 RepID=A0A5E7RCC4_PSEFL|nr:hypothetical protein [Pseudomonas fluorescens]VVP71097.1 hypothetical protein PS918_01127 [Pseudomonas fluorescens]
MAELSTLNENYQRISTLLRTSKGELKYQDVVGSMGAESAFAAFEAERKLLRESITSKMKLTSRPDLSGSGGPRSILAYYAALWRTCQDVTGTYDIPVVIDSPNQQAQDDINLPAVLQFIAKELPEDMQLIVGMETPRDFPFDREIRLDVKYSMLREDYWDEAERIIEPLLKKMYATMKSDVEESSDEVSKQ